MAIVVTNLSEGDIEVSINRWGTGGNTSPKKLDSGKTESWSRSNERGFVMYITMDGSGTPYFVLNDSVITVLDVNRVEDQGRQITPATDRFIDMNT